MVLNPFASFSLLATLGLALAPLNQLSAAPGDLDPTFHPLTGLTGQVEPRADGKIIVLGDYVEGADGDGVNLKRLNADGTADGGFVSPFKDFKLDFYRFAVLPDNRLIVGGGIPNVAGGVTSYLNRLKPDGAIDTSFKLVPNVSFVTDFLVQSDGKLVLNTQVIGDTTFHTVISRIKTDGTLDRTFATDSSFVSSVVTGFALDPNGKVALWGTFASVTGAVVDSFSTARLLTNGKFDSSFKRAAVLTSGVDGAYKIAVQPDGKWIVSGVHYESFTPVNAFLRRYNADGSLDANFKPVITASGELGAVSPRIAAITVQKNGKILIGGAFGAVNGVKRVNLARLNADGSLDQTFVTPATLQTTSHTQVLDITEQADGRLLVAGYMYFVQSNSGLTTLYGLVRLLNDDSVPPPMVKAADLVPSVALKKVIPRDTRTIIKANVGLTNLGKKKAKNVEVAVYLSDDATLDTRDELLKTVSFADLGFPKIYKHSTAGPVKVKVKVPATTAVSGKHLLIVADPADNISESDETNNVAASGVIE